MPLDQLPQELLCTILSHLDKTEDYPSLLACALTCKALVFPAQANIFHTVTLSNEFPHVLAKLESTPHVRKFIKHLGFMEIHKPWIQSSEVLRDILNSLSPYITSLDIHQRIRRAEKPRFDFSTLSRLECVEKISLKEEELSGKESDRYNDIALPTFLNHFPKLNSLIFDECYVNNIITDGKPDVHAPIFRLKKLDIQICYDTFVLDWLLPALSSLQSLRIQYPSLRPPFYVATFTRFMTVAGESLQHLEIRGLHGVSETDLKLMMTAVAAHTPNLRSLVLLAPGSTSEESIMVLLECLLLIGTHKDLQDLTVGFYQSEGLLDRSPWNDLQDILLGTHFPALTTVQLRLLLPSSESNPMREESVVAAVPRLAQKKKVFVRHSGW